MNDLKAAISRAKMALSAVPKEHPDRAKMVKNVKNMKRECSTEITYCWELILIGTGARGDHVIPVAREQSTFHGHK